MQKAKIVTREIDLNGRKLTLETGYLAQAADSAVLATWGETVLLATVATKPLAEDMGLKVERRPIPFDELGSFEEVGACGTAAVISPICQITDRDTGKTFSYCQAGNAGPISTMLYNRLRAIQLGEEPDKFGWNIIVS